MSDERPEPDVVVETALRLLPVPDHEPSFWTRLEAALDAEPLPGRPTVGARPGPAVTVEEETSGPGGEPGRASPGGPGAGGADAARRVADAVPVVELAPTPVPGVVPPAMRRRSNLVLSALAVAAAVAVVVAGASLVRSRTDDDPATEEVAEEPTTDGAAGAGDGAPSSTVGAALSAAAGDDPAAAVVVEWLQAVAAGDIDRAWALLGPASQAHWGSASALAGERSALAEGYGAWASAEPDAVLVTPLGTSGDREVVVVTLVGAVEQEGTVSTRADAFPVHLAEDEGFLELYASAGVMEIVIPEDAAPDGSRPPMAPADEIVLVVPEAVEAPLLRLDDGEVVVCGEAPGTELTELEGASGRRCGYAPPGGLPTGDHVLTAAFTSSDGRLVTAHSARFTVR